MLQPTKRRPTHPGVVLLEDYLKPLGMTQAECAKRLDISRVRLNEIVKGKRGITPDRALRLSRLFENTDPASWMNMQQAVDLWDAMRSKAAKNIEKIEPVMFVRAV